VAKWVVNLLCISEALCPFIFQRPAILNEILRHFTQYNQTNIGSRLKLGYIRVLYIISNVFLTLFLQLALCNRNY